MGVVDELIEVLVKVTPRIEEVVAEKVVVGLGYTGVLTSRGHMGLCQTLLGEMNLHCCRISVKAGTLASSKIINLLMMAKSWDLSERIVGIAAINALSAPYLDGGDEVKVFKGNLIEHLDLRRGDLVVMVGNVKPFREPIKAKGCKLVVLERSLQLMDEETLPDVAGDEMIPKADVVVASGTSLANGTIDRILKLAEKAREVALVGPSASAYPKVLFDRGVTVVGCIKVLNPSMVLRVISEGGGVREFRPYVEQVVLRRS
ncbi:MAG: DUF364 domain-containing protein [Candidatus Nezhaarchaeota archaeon]|nr:DUF364 domain-containing protein [Candidatus Nezhaarchaeota archaeon]MCX8142281.1 DUF364 domain-containing protein [Candidatus Nezhaarchaeota archaeon]MDW8050746.1 DUF364 domain-containing protein [Nitrososphaerota archaeon]